jgi:hypothetical protein
MTRLASSPSDLWQGILAQNADFTDEALRRLIADLPTRAELESGDWTRDAFTRAAAARGRSRAREPR